MQPGIVLASATSPTEQAAFDELVHRGVEYDAVADSYPPSSDRVVHAWTVPENDDVDPTRISAGDFVLFYRGSNRYKWAAQITRVDQDPELAHDLNTRVDDAAPAAHPHDELSNIVLWLTIPVPIEIQSFELHDLFGLDQKALTRTIIPQADAIDELVEEYGSLEAMLTAHREPPSVFVEKTSLSDKPYKQPGEELELGSGAFSSSESVDGSDSYGTLREPEVGDLVFHILTDTREFRGVSIVTSTLRNDFQGPSDGSRTPNTEGGGYFLPLGGYRAFENAVNFDDALLDNDDYHPRLKEIYEVHDGLLYDQNFELVQGGYFTKLPIDLLYLFIAIEPRLLADIRDVYWDLQPPEPADKYKKVSETVVDVRTRLPFTSTGRDWFQEAFTQTVIETLSESLTRVEPNAELDRTQAVHCELIKRLYFANEETLTAITEEVGIGATNRISHAETLFFVLFRELQSRTGVNPNMNQVKIDTLVNENYTVEAPTLDAPVDEVGPLTPREKPEEGDEIARQLVGSGQMVFYGPPGTGKTYTAKRFAHWWLNEQDGVDAHTGQLETVTFHPSFTYEDFVEGLSVDTNEEGSVTYDEQPGVFLQFANEAKRAYHAAGDDEEAPRYVLIIDEINRGNLAQIFGEMITALESDKRLDGENETQVSLAHSGDVFHLPPNLYLIGTMNTADRSIALVDAALRRRFRFLSFPPKLRLLREEHELGDWADVDRIASAPSHPDSLLAQSLIAVYELNKRIRSEHDLGRGKQIGHSFLFGVGTDTEIVDTWRFEILPLLEEYLFGQYSRIREVLFVGDGEALFDWEREQIKSFDADELSTALEPFVAEFDSSEVTDDD